MGRFTGLIILMLVFAFLLRVDFIFYIIYVVMGVFLWSRWYTPRALKGIRTSREFNAHAFWGEPVTIDVVVQNANRLPVPWVEFTETVAIELFSEDKISRAISLRGRGTTRFSYPIKAQRRGYYQLGPMRFATSDLFGLNEELVGFVDADFITVYPRLIPLHRLGLPSRLPFGTIASHQRLFEDPARPAGVRDYQTGDSLRRINWKVSAHTRGLKVKTFQPAISLDTAVLLNLNQQEYTRTDRRGLLEWAIVVAASLAAHLIDRRQSVGLITNGLDPLSSNQTLVFDSDSGRLVIADSADRNDPNAAQLPPVIPPRPGRPHLIKILERLARIESQTTPPLPNWIATTTLSLSWGVTILVVTARGDEATCNALHRLVRQGFNPVLIAIEPDGRFGLVRERARHLGFVAYNVADVRDMNTWRQPVRGAG